MDQNEIINFQEYRTFSETMNATYGFLRQNYKGFAKSLLFFAAPLVLLGSVFYYQIIGRMIDQSGVRALGNPYAAQEYFESANFILVLIAAMIFLLIGGVFTVSVTYSYFLLYHEKKTTQIELGEVWQKTLSLFWSNFGTMFMYTLGMMLALVVLMIPLFILIYIFSFAGGTAGVILAGAYYIAIIALCVFFSELFIIRCRERIGFFDAVSRLMSISKGQFWKTILIGGVNMYIQAVLSILFILPWYLYFFLMMMHSVSNNVIEAQPFWQEALGTALLMIYSLASVLLTAIPLIAIGFQYFNLVELREARGLMLEIQEFGQVEAVTQEHEDY